jgi:putative transposase
MGSQGPDLTGMVFSPLSLGEDFMVGKDHYEKSDRDTAEKKARSSKPGNDRRVDLRGRAQGKHRRGVSKRRHRAKSFLPLEAEVQGRRRPGPARTQARSQNDRPRKARASGRKCTSKGRLLRGVDRAAIAQKKRELGLNGSLKKRHLPLETRKSLLESINEATRRGETMTAICQTLDLNPRAVYRWKSNPSPKVKHGGGGGLNKIKPLEEKRVVSLARKFPQFRCRRIAYELERQAKVFIGKTKVAEIMKVHGLNHEFVRGSKPPKQEPLDFLLHEPWRKNLLWGTDWTWVDVGERFMFLLVVLDWYSRKIIAWGLFWQITSFEVVAVITDAVAIEKIDALPDGEMKPRVVADHGSANISRYTRSNIEIQGLDLWLSGIGRPTGNARTERVIGTLKREEIDLQETYASEVEARKRIAAAIWDYNFNRPNSGVGGFAPNSVHHLGRAALLAMRHRARALTALARRGYWKDLGINQGLTDHADPI